MKLATISGGSCRAGDEDDPTCTSGDCPTVYVTDRGTVAVQGYNVEHLAPEGESVVEIPRVGRAAAEGRPIQRVRVLRRPLSDYVRFEFAYGYDFSSPAGEAIRIADVTDSDPGLPGEDWWLFDETTVVRMLYRDDGPQIGRGLVQDPDLEQYLRWRDLAPAVSVPYAECQP